MANISFKGSPIKTQGDLPAVGAKAPAFVLTKSDLSSVSLTDLKGKKLILNIFPSLDTGVCATSVRKFNAEAAKLDNTLVLCISKDLPFAHSRFCSAEGIENVISLSEYKTNSFADNYGVTIVDAPLDGLFSRSIVVINEDGEVLYTEQVPDIVQEPDYAKAIAALK